MIIDGGNRSTIQCITTKLQVDLIDCASYRVQLSLQKLISEKEETIANVYRLIVNLGTQTMQVKQLQYTLLHLKLSNEKRRTFTYTLLSRHIERRDFVAGMYVKRVNDFLLNALSKQIVDALFQKLEKYNVVLKL